MYIKFHRVTGIDRSLVGQTFQVKISGKDLKEIMEQAGELVKQLEEVYGFRYKFGYTLYPGSNELT